MQSKKDLAEAGRRKLEEFRKAKAAGKAAPTTSKTASTDEHPAAPAQGPPLAPNGPNSQVQPPAPLSGSGSSANSIVPNGTSANGNGHAPWAPSVPTPGPTPVWGQVGAPYPTAGSAAVSANAGISVTGYSAPYAQQKQPASVIPESNGHHLTREPAVPAGQAQTQWLPSAPRIAGAQGPAAPNGDPSPSKVSPTSFVVLEHAPIPFGSPGYRPPSQPGSAAVGDAAAAPQAEGSMGGTGGGIPWLPANPTPFPLEVAAPPPAAPVSAPPVSTFWQPQPQEPPVNPPPAPQPAPHAYQYGSNASSTGVAPTAAAPAIPFDGPCTGGAPDASAEFDAALGLSPLAPAQGSGTQPVFANVQPSASAVTAIGGAGNADAPWASGGQSRSGSETGAAGGAACSQASIAATTGLNGPTPWGVTAAAEALPAAPAPWRPEPAPSAPPPPPVMPSAPGAEGFAAGSSILPPPPTAAHPYYATVGSHPATEVQNSTAPPSSSPKASFWSWGNGGGAKAALPPPASKPSISWLPQPVPFADGRSASTEEGPVAAEPGVLGHHDSATAQSSGAGEVGGHGHTDSAAEAQAASEPSVGMEAPGGYSANYSLPQGPAAVVQLPEALGHAPPADEQRWNGEPAAWNYAASSSQGIGAALESSATGRGASEADSAPTSAAGADSKDDTCGYGLLADMYLSPSAAAAPAATLSTATAAAPSASPTEPAVTNSSSSGGGTGGSSGPSYVAMDDGPDRKTSTGGAPSEALPVSFGGALDGVPVPPGPAAETYWQPPHEPARPPSPPPAAPASPAAPSPAPSRFSWLFGGGKTPSKDKPAQQAAQPPAGPPSRPRSLDQQLAAAGPQQTPQQVVAPGDATSGGALPQADVASGVWGAGHGAEGNVCAGEVPGTNGYEADGLFAGSGMYAPGTQQQQPHLEEAHAVTQPQDSLPTFMSLGVWGPAGTGAASSKLSDPVPTTHSSAASAHERGQTDSAPLWESGLGVSSGGGEAGGVAAVGGDASASRQDFGSSAYVPSFLREEAAAAVSVAPPSTSPLAPLPWERDQPDPMTTASQASGMPSFGGMVPDVAAASTEPPRADASSGASRYLPEPPSSAPQPTGLPPLPPTSAAASATTPSFLAAASYLSAYSASSTPPTSSSALTLPPPTSTYAPPPPLSGATGTTSTLGTSTLPYAAGAGAPASTSSFLESYLDNLLSTMSTAKDSNGPATDSAKQPHGGPVTAENSMHGTMGVSGSASRRTSHTGDGDSEHPAPSAAGDADLGAGAGSAALHGRKQSAGAVGGEHAAAGSVRSHPTSHHGGHGLGGVPHVDSSLHLPHHSRQQSVDSIDASVLSHATGTVHSAMPGGAHSGGSRAQFAALQQHIDELTEEKLQLARGLQQQTRINEQLSEENGELMRQYNARGTMVEELQRKIKRYEQELEAQALSLEGFSSDRQAAMSSYQEATSRAQALAAEVVGLEAQVLQLKSAVLKAERAAEEAQKRATKLEKQVATLTTAAAERANELQQTQLKGRNLVVKLKQTEAKLREAEEKLEEHAAAAGPGAPPARGFLGRGRHTTAAPKVETAELEVQCTLGDELAAEAAAAAAAAAEMERLAAEVAAEAAREAAAEAAVEAAAAGLPPRALSEGARPSGSGGAESMQLMEWAGPQRPLRDPPSAVLAEQAMASIDTRALRRAGAASAGAGALPEGVDVVAAALSRWLPAGPVGGSNPVALIAEEEVRLIESIHDMLGNFEQAQAEAHAEIERLEARIVSLSAENSDLRHKLELQTQRLELELQGSKLAVSLHHTPVSHALGPAAPASASAVNVGAAGDVATPSGQQGLAEQHGPMQQQQQQHSHSAGAAINSANVSAEAAVTPTRSASTSVRRPPLMSLDDAADAVQSPPQRQGWIGYLFRPRQKKRVRSAVL